MKYLYDCPKCKGFEVEKPMAEASRSEVCPQCGQVAQRKYVGLPFSFGFRLTDATRERFGPRDEFEPDV